ncbi:calcium uptake protein 2, mitochondrial [Cheilinus undulatus]|uniref:calcium uptake protein 2, mitochondrial n=1 Tax=Cheilinus undulatus TaxID=241271 RepID=UPI001BD60248|nr:calcium uptake protein 2, mitochondrial [Cheilinus undulatus]
MSSWGRVSAALRTVLRSPRSLKSPGLRRVVGPGVLGSVVGAGVVCYYHYQANYRTLPFAVHAEEQKDAAVPHMSARKVRFDKFASVIYEQELYMTPRDFLYSVMLENVDRKLQKRILTREEVNKMLKAASRARAGNDLFRSLGDNGLISYDEYLFLLTILTKPRTGFHIAFKMLDVDGNEHVDKKEFLKLKKIIGKSKRRAAKDGIEIQAEEGDSVNTTLQAYFFGKKGENKLQYQQFRRFMEDLQAEVQEMEFLQFSKGMDTMRREDFAEWLLHYTNEEDNEVYWENMRKKIPAGQSITFDEFKAFCLFTNNLEDFAFSMKMVTEANRPVGMAQFKRAVRIATGHDLSESVLDTVFKLFDMDGDNCLSHKEFIGVMNDRVLRGLKVQHQTGISGYWKCVKRETLKGAREALGDTGCPI